MSPPDFQSLKRKMAKFQVENINVGGNKKNYAIRALNKAWHSGQ